MRKRREKERVGGRWEGGSEGMRKGRWEEE